VGGHRGLPQPGRGRPPEQDAVRLQLERFLPVRRLGQQDGLRGPESAR